jgi:hypothetical protein
MDDVGLSSSSFKNPFFVGDVPIYNPDILVLPAPRDAVSGEDIG